MPSEYSDWCSSTIFRKRRLTSYSTSCCYCTVKKFSMISTENILFYAKDPNSVQLGSFHIRGARLPVKEDTHFKTSTRQEWARDLASRRWDGKEKIRNQKPPAIIDRNNSHSETEPDIFCRKLRIEQPSLCIAGADQSVSRRKSRWDSLFRVYPTVLACFLA